MADDGDLIGRLPRSVSEERGGMNEYESKRLIAGLGIDVPAGRLLPPDGIDRPDLDGLSGPFAVKFVSSRIHHKTELGAVRIDVPAEDVPAVCRRMAASPELAGYPCEGFLVEEMVSAPAQEMVVGGLHDPTFGPVVMLGIGGVLLEVLDDVSFRVCPVDAHDVRSMLRELRGFRLLQGYRGSAAADLDALVEAVLAIGGEDGLLMSAYPTAVEIDVNPILVNELGAVAVDAQVLMMEHAR